LAALLFVVAFAQALGSNLSLALVLERLGAARLPVLTMLHAGFLAAATVVVARRAHGASARWLSRALIVTALLVIASGALEARGVSWSVVVLYLVTGVLGDVAGALFWVMANQRFDMRAAKRAFPGIGAAGTTGAALAGFLAPAATRGLGTRGLFAMLVVAQALAAISCVALTRSDAEQNDTPPVRSRVTSAGGREREDVDLTRAIVIGAVVVSAVTFFGRYLYARALERALGGDLAAIVAQNGLLMATASVLTALTQLAISPALMGRLGVRATMMVYPLALIVVFAALAARFGLVTGVLAYFATTVVRKGMQAPAEGVLPAALSSAQTSRAVLLATAVGAPAGMLLGGAALRAGRSASAEAIAVGGLALAALLVWVTVWRARSYTDSLRLRLRKGGSELRLRLLGALGNLGDVRAILGQGLDPDAPGLLGNLETLVRVQREAERAGEVVSVSRGRMSEVIDRRLAEAYRLRAAMDRLVCPGAPRGLEELWRQAIRHRLEQDALIVLYAVRAATGEPDLDRVAPRLFDVDARARGAAVEILETLCPPDTRTLLVPLIEGVGLNEARDAASLRFGPTAADPIHDLLDVPDDWLRAITVYALVSNGVDRYRDRIAALRGTADPWLSLACERALAVA